MTMHEKFFPSRPDVHPKVYAYRAIYSEYEGYLKVGYTERAVEVRVAEQFPVIQPGEIKPYEILFAESAMRSDGTSFTDYDLHRRLERNGFDNVGGEWFRCSVDDVRNAWLQVRDRVDYSANRTEDFPMRPEQRTAVEKTEAYFRDCERPGNRNAPKFLWNAKMRFGKTFASYQLAKRMNMKRVLVLTFKPAVESAWQEDLETHVDFEGWQFVSRGGRSYDECDPDKPIVCFGSFQDFLGEDRSTGGIKPRNEWVHLEDWDMVVFDEYHFGAWKDSAKSLFRNDSDDAIDDADDANAAAQGNSLDETWLPIQSRFYLYLSGTPFRALNSGEFIEEQVFNWTYSDEQRCKTEWVGENNPYEALPRVVMMTYKVPDSITQIAREGEFDEFDLNVFFSAEGSGADAHFKYEEYVQKWLDLIRGSFKDTARDDLRMGAQKPPMPFSHKDLLPVLTHTLWFLPNVASCEAMFNLLAKRQNVFYHDYKVIVAAGNKAGMGVEAVGPVRKAMGDPLATKTITLSCGKLTTGVTIKPWSGVLMLRNLKSPETYFQTAFRAQSPWTAKTEEGKTEILKRDCYVFDFSLNRALGMISDYSCRLSVDETSPERKVAEFVKFLPVLAYDGSAMQEVNAAQILDIAMAGTSATLLARRWESALLVNVDNNTLLRLLANEDAMNALMSIEGFRSLNQDIETIVNKSEAVKKAKKEGGNLSDKEKKRLSQEEKEFKSKRKEIQEKLIKFATRIPVFMYLTDRREETLKHVITQFEPKLFKKVTGLGVKDFELLVSLGVFRDDIVNDAVYKFRRYEDRSLDYTGINMHVFDTSVGLFDTKLSKADYEELKLRDSLLNPDGRARNRDDEVIVESYTIDQRTPKTKVTHRVETMSAPELKETARKAHREEPSDSRGPSPKANGASREAAHPRAAKPITAATTNTKKSSLAPGNKRTTASNDAASYAQAARERVAARRSEQAARKKDPAKPKIEPLTPEQIASIGAGTRVFHKGFGPGKVTRVTGGTIYVFAKGKERMFLFPQAFDQGFLSL